LRTVRGYSPLRTGTRYLPIAAAHLFTCFAQVHLLVPIYKKTWQLSPLVFLFSSLAQMALAAGLMSRFDSSTSISTFLGLQILFSIGAGLGAFQVVWAGLTIAIRGRGTPTDVLTWVSFAIFAEMLGASVGISIAQTVFMTQLSREVRSNGLNLDYLLHSGVTNFKEGLNSEQLDTVIVVFNTAISRTFYVPTAAGAWPFGLAALILWVCIPISPCLYLLWKPERPRSHSMDNPAPPPPAEMPSLPFQPTVSPAPVSGVIYSELHHNVGQPITVF
jgi:hypothetical protein